MDDDARQFLDPDKVPYSPADHKRRVTQREVEHKLREERLKAAKEAEGKKLADAVAALNSMSLTEAETEALRAFQRLGQDARIHELYATVKTRRGL